MIARIKCNVAAKTRFALACDLGRAIRESLRNHRHRHEIQHVGVDEIVVESSLSMADWARVGEDGQFLIMEVIAW